MKFRVGGPSDDWHDVSVDYDRQHPSGDVWLHIDIPEGLEVIDFRVDHRGEHAGDHEAVSGKTYHVALRVGVAKRPRPVYTVGAKGGATNGER